MPSLYESAGKYRQMEENSGETRREGVGANGRGGNNNLPSILEYALKHGIGAASKAFNIPEARVSVWVSEQLSEQQKSQQQRVKNAVAANTPTAAAATTTTTTTPRASGLPQRQSPLTSNISGGYNDILTEIGKEFINNCSECFQQNAQSAGKQMSIQEAKALFNEMIFGQGSPGSGGARDKRASFQELMSNPTLNQRIFQDALQKSIQGAENIMVNNPMACRLIVQNNPSIRLPNRNNNINSYANRNVPMTIPNGASSSPGSRGPRKPEDFLRSRLKVILYIYIYIIYIICVCVVRATGRGAYPKGDSCSVGGRKAGDLP